MGNWGEPERAPHKREVRTARLSVCLSVRTFITRKYTRVVVIYLMLLKHGAPVSMVWNS